LKEQVRLAQAEIDKYPGRSIKEWQQLAEEYAASPEGCGKSARKASSVASILAGTTTTTQNEKSSDSVAVLQDDDDDNNNVAGLDDNSTLEEAEAINPEGIPLNEHVLPGEEDFNNDSYLNINVNNQFESNMFPTLTKQEATAVQLLDLLRKKKTSLDTYDEVMLWHL
jgi:hypothetical protein